MRRPNHPSTGLIGIRVDNRGRPIKVKDERDHLQLCGICNQYYDKRDLGLVMYHMEEIHDPLPLDS